MATNTFRSLPGVDSLLAQTLCKRLVERYGRPLVTFAIRDVLSALRGKMAKKTAQVSVESILAQVESRVTALAEASLKPVVNASGIVLHTNLGRAPLGRRIVDDIVKTVHGYTNLEFDLDAGRRGHRNKHVIPLLRYLTGAEDAVVVNNNAAAIVLTLNTLARGKEVIISRGELVEIGGAFRIPEIMRAAGSRMVEVGTTNRTRLADYERALGAKTALIFKAHKSNYAIKGFTEEVAVDRLAAFARTHDLPLVFDIGSGLLRKPRGLPLEREPDVAGAITDGADLVTFSCDKLLGGPQAGVAAGRRDLVARLAKAPLMRALRVGKLTLAALSSACRQYLSDERLTKDNPTFAMLQQSAEVLNARAARLKEQLEAGGAAAEIVPSSAQVGGGSLPDLELPSIAVRLVPPEGSSRQRERFAERLLRGLLDAEPPVLGVLREGRLLFDVFTMLDDQIPIAANAVSSVLKGKAQR